MKATSACGTFYLLMDVVILATAISKCHHSVLCFTAAWNLLPPSLCLQIVLQKQIALGIPMNFPSNPTALRNNWNIIQIFKTTHDKLGKNPLISVRSSLDFTLGKLSLGNSISTDCVFPRHLLHISKGENRVIGKLFYLTNISTNVVKKPPMTGKKKKKLLPVARADAHLAQASGSCIKKQMRERLWLWLPREGGDSSRGLKLLEVGLSIRWGTAYSFPWSPSIQKSIIQWVDNKKGTSKQKIDG